MSPERALLGGAVGVLVVSLVVAAAAPGTLATPSEELRRPGPVDVAEVAVEPGEITGETAELRVRAQVAHRGDPTPNVTVRVRAVDAESGFVAAERRVDLGTVRGEGWQPVNVSVRVPREGGYTLETTVFRDGRPADADRKRLAGLAALTPAYARTAVGFTDDGSVPTVGVSVAEGGEDRTTLSVRTRLTNTGDDPSEDLRMVVVLRQAGSNLVADEAETTVGAIRPGRTDRVETAVEVPSGYNYYVDVELYKDGVLVDAVRGIANLDPQERIQADETVRDVEFNVSDFEREGGRRIDRRGRVPAEGVGPAAVVAGGGGGAAVLPRGVERHLDVGQPGVPVAVPGGVQPGRPAAGGGRHRPAAAADG